MAILYHPITILALFQFVDIILGVIAAMVNKSFTSTTMKLGLLKDFGIFAAVTVVYVFIGSINPVELGVPKNLHVDILGANVPLTPTVGAKLFIYLFILNQISSWFENLDAAGVPVPALVRKVFLKVNDTINEKEV